MGGGRLLARATSELGLGPGGSPGRALAVLVGALITAFGLASWATSPSDQSGRPGTRDPVERVTDADRTPRRNAAPMGLGRAAPVRVVIPEIDVDVRVVPLRGLGDELGASLATGVAGWYEHGTSPGEIGSAVIMGRRADSNGSPAAFAGLERLTAGDRIDVVRADGITASFTVEQVVPYSPTDHYRRLDAKARLRLVAIGPGGAGPNHDARPRPELVVFATVAERQPAPGADQRAPGEAAPAPDRAAPPGGQPVPVEAWPAPSDGDPAAGEGQSTPGLAHPAPG